MPRDYYSETQKIAFRVQGYDDESVASIVRGADAFASHVGIPPERVYTFVVRKSRRHKNVRVFYASLVDAAPEGAFDLGPGWTMSTWLED